MEKKKLKLSISGSSKKTFSSIEEAKSKSPPRVAPLPNLKPLPSCIFFFNSLININRIIFNI